MPIWSPTGICSLKASRWRSIYPVPRIPQVIDYADITITVVGDVASATDGVAYSWEVWEGGLGAPANKLGVSGDIAFFSHSGTDYQFLVSPGGSGGVSFTVTNDVGSITVGASDYQWPVYLA
jgi:hypothetical protein